MLDAAKLVPTTCSCPYQHLLCPWQQHTLALTLGELVVAIQEPLGKRQRQRLDPRIIRIHGSLPHGNALIQRLACCAADIISHPELIRGWMGGEVPGDVGQHRLLAMNGGGRAIVSIIDLD